MSTADRIYGVAVSLFAFAVAARFGWLLLELRE